MAFTYDPNSQEWDDGYDDDNYTVIGCDDEHEEGITELDTFDAD